MRKAMGCLLILAIVVSLAVVQRAVLFDIWQRLIDLPVISFFPLAVAAVVMIVARGAFLAACSPGIKLRQAITADQTALAAGYGIALGGGLVGTVPAFICSRGGEYLTRPLRRQLLRLRLSRLFQRGVFRLWFLQFRFWWARQHQQKCWPSLLVY